MKKVLLTTTALVMTAGVASAEITFSGKGEAGFYQQQSNSGSSCEQLAVERALLPRVATRMATARHTDAAYNRR